MNPKQDPNAVNEDLDAAVPDNIGRIERKAEALANGMADKLRIVIDNVCFSAYVVARISEGTNSADLSGIDQGGADGSATHEVYETSNQGSGEQ